MLLEKRKYSCTNLSREFRSNEPADFENYSRVESRTFYALFDSKFVVHTKSAKVVLYSGVKIFRRLKRV